MLVGASGGGSKVGRGRRMAAPDVRPVRRAHQERRRRYPQRGGEMGRSDHGGEVSRTVRERETVGASRHRRPGVCIRRQAVSRRRRDGCHGADAGGCGEDEYPVRSTQYAIVLSTRYYVLGTAYSFFESPACPTPPAPLESSGTSPICT